MDFKHFSGRLLACIIGSFICFAFATITAYYKNKYTSSVYALLVITFGSWMLGLTNEVSDFEEQAQE